MLCNSEPSQQNTSLTSLSAYFTRVECAPYFGTWTGDLGSNWAEIHGRSTSVRAVPTVGASGKSLWMIVRPLFSLAGACGVLEVPGSRGCCTLGGGARRGPAPGGRGKRGKVRPSALSTFDAGIPHCRLIWLSATRSFLASVPWVYLAHTSPSRLPLWVSCPFVPFVCVYVSSRQTCCGRGGQQATSC